MSFKQAKMMHTILLLLESILFGLFVCAILVDQVQAILTDETAIEAKQQKGGWRYHKSKLALLSEVCGRGHPILWLLPCQTTHRKQGEPLLTHDV
uniref:Putative secreted protein n=1 Tax=Xenopsylla cheopis TaxID=163159 RepID=A0A6M2DVE3_XENCH